MKATYRQYFIKAIEVNFPDRASGIITSVDNHFIEIYEDVRFAATSENPIDKRLDFSAYFLALIKKLDEQGESFELIRKVCLEVVTDYVRPRSKFQKVIKQLPAKLTNTWLASLVIKQFNKRISKNTNPGGFVANIITDKQETFGLGYGIDIIECGICKLFEKHSHSKFSSILCEVDELTSGFAGLQLVRTSTIALGAKKCDFRFKKK